MTSLYSTLIIRDIKQEARNAKTFVLESQSGNRIDYKPGQYLTFILPGIQEETRRSYSIISSPALNEELAIGVKRVENGIFSRWLIDKAKVGDEILTSGVGGFFTLPEDINAYKQVFFLAAGSGITPIFSLIKTILYSYPQISVVLIYSNRSVEESMYHDELKKLAEKHAGRFQIEFLYSNASAINRARLYRDLLIGFLKRYTITSYNQSLAYICGPIDYMRMCTYALHLAGMPFENIKKENFSTDKPAILPSPPDKNAHIIQLQFHKNKYTFSSKYPDTILQAAKKNNIDLPYSCEAGKCGNCAAHIINGKVWMSYNEVLTDKDLAKGLTLTCVGYPVEGDVSLQVI